MDKKVILLDVDNTAFKKVIVLETLKKNPKLALKLLLRKPTFYVYGALYKLLGTDGMRRRFFEEMHSVPVAEFDVKDIDPEYLKIIRLAQWKGHKVIFLTSNPPNITKKWEERIRNMFPRLDFEVRPVPTMEEKIRFAKDIAREVGGKNVHFFDDSLPLTAGLGSPFSRIKMEMDKAVLLREHDRIARILDKATKNYFDNLRRIAEKRGELRSAPISETISPKHSVELQREERKPSRWRFLHRGRRK